MYAGRRNAAATAVSNGNNTAGAASAAASAMNGGARGKRGAASSSSAAANAANADFHPKLIASQIVCLQCFHYFLLAVFFQINSFLYGTSVTLDRIFTDKHLHLRRVTGWPDCAAVLLAALVGAVLLTIIVEKSKKCLDFAATLFVVHLILCTWYGGMPRQLDWWMVHVAGTVLTVLLGEYLCSRREMEDIPLLQL